VRVQDPHAVGPLFGVTQERTLADSRFAPDNERPSRTGSSLSEHRIDVLALGRTPYEHQPIVPLREGRA